MKQIVAAFFSPTGGTKSIVRMIVSQLEELLHYDVRELDLTSPESRKRVYAFSKEDLLVLGTPVYAGRVPNLIAPDLLKGLRGSGTYAVAVNAFGNRNYDGAPDELKQILEKTGFVPIGAAAIANRHAFSDQIGTTRPDDQDLSAIQKWSEQLAEKIRNGSSESLKSVLDLELKPYYRPLGVDGKPASFLKAKPVTDPVKCTHCGICAQKCPMGSIVWGREEAVTGICIKCQACIRSCPVHAKCFTDEAFLSHVRFLELNCMKPSGNYYEI